MRNLFLRHAISWAGRSDGSLDANRGTKDSSRLYRRNHPQVSIRTRSSENLAISMAYPEGEGEAAPLIHKGFSPAPSPRAQTRYPSSYSRRSRQPSISNTPFRLAALGACGVGSKLIAELTHVTWTADVLLRDTVTSGCGRTRPRPMSRGNSEFDRSQDAQRFASGRTTSSATAGVDASRHSRHGGRTTGSGRKQTGGSGRPSANSGRSIKVIGHAVRGRGLRAY